MDSAQKYRMKDIDLPVICNVSASFDKLQE